MKTQKLPLIASLSLLIPFAGSASAADSSIYNDIIAPLMEAKCVKCHGEEKQKGKLRLDTHAFIMQGADEEQIVFPGKLEEGTFFERLYLPLDDDDHMPPEDEDQLTEGETKLLEWWVKEGAKADLTIAKANKPKDLEPVIAAFLKNTPKAASTAKKEPTEAEKKASAEAMKVAAAAMAKVNATGATLMPISAEDESQLRFTALNVAKDFGDAQMVTLKPVASQVLWLDLAGTNVTDKGLAQVAGMKNLTRLYLQNTAITDAGLNHLRGLSNLEYLNLYGSKISDAGIGKLAGLKKLTSLFIWQTKVTEKGAASLEKKVPGLKANIGWTEKDNAVVVASAAPPKKAVAPAAVTDAKALADAKVAAAKAKKAADDAAKAAAAKKAVADAAQKKLAELEKKAKAAAAAKKPVAPVAKPAAAKPKAEPKAELKPVVKPKPKAKAKAKANAEPKPVVKPKPKAAKKEAKPKRETKPKR